MSFCSCKKNKIPKDCENLEIPDNKEECDKLKGCKWIQGYYRKEYNKNLKIALYVILGVVIIFIIGFGIYKFRMKKS